MTASSLIPTCDLGAAGRCSLFGKLQSCFEIDFKGKVTSTGPSTGIIQHVSNPRSTHSPADCTGMCVGTSAGVSRPGPALKSRLLGLFPQVNKKVTFSPGACAGTGNAKEARSRKCQGGIILSARGAKCCCLTSP